MIVNPANHQISGGSYDANGNDTSVGSYNVANQLVQAGAVKYGYDPDGKRVWKSPDGAAADEEFYFWAPNGQRLGTYKSTNPGMTGFTTVNTNLYFGGRLIQAQGTAILTDRLGSNVTGGKRYYPYGQEKPSATANEIEKFAGYFRDSETGLDYAINRYEAPGTGRFATPDPLGEMNLIDPTDTCSLNRYAYANDDPVNNTDPSGLSPCSQGRVGLDGPTVGSFFNSNTDLGMLAETVFTESSMSATGEGPAEMGAIASVIMNRWQILNGYYHITDSNGRLIQPSPDWGPPSASLAQVLNPSNFAVWAAPGELAPGAQNRLNYALNSDFTSALCNGLVNALGTADLFLSEQDDHELYTLNGLVLTSFNSFGHASSRLYEQAAGSFGDANVFYGIPSDQATAVVGGPAPLPPRPLKRRKGAPRSSGAGGRKPNIL